jgi:hypothetical protein
MAGYEGHRDAQDEAVSLGKRLIDDMKDEAKTA